MEKEKQKMEVVWRKTEEVKPYENNPRKNDGAVDAVAESIKAFGFRQPILVDRNGVIIDRWETFTGGKAELIE